MPAFGKRYFTLVLLITWTLWCCPLFPPEIHPKFSWTSCERCKCTCLLFFLAGKLSRCLRKRTLGEMSSSGAVSKKQTGSTQTLLKRRQRMKALGQLVENHIPSLYQVLWKVLWEARYVLATCLSTWLLIWVDCFSYWRICYNIDYPVPKPMEWRGITVTNVYIGNFFFGL